MKLLLNYCNANLMNQKNKNLLFIAVAIFLPIFYGVFFIRNFSMPLSGGGDVDEWEYVGYYLAVIALCSLAGLWMLRPAK
jgi:hypothetical protein